jgi:hypothetical protein
VLRVLFELRLRAVAYSVWMDCPSVMSGETDGSGGTPDGMGKFVVGEGGGVGVVAEALRFGAAVMAIAMNMPATRRPPLALNPIE